MNRLPSVVLTLLSILVISACSRAPQPVGMEHPSGDPPVVPMPASATAITTSGPIANPIPATPLTSDLPLMVVHKSETCGCCELWVEHMQEAGFDVEVRNTNDFGSIKARVGVPLGKGSCHTAEVGGYFVEGHIPADDVRRLLALAPDAKGLVVPGMPLGSPGMEIPDGRTQPYTVELVGRDGTTSEFARHGE